MYIAAPCAGVCALVRTRVSHPKPGRSLFLSRFCLARPLLCFCFRVGLAALCIEGCTGRHVVCRACELTAL